MVEGQRGNRRRHDTRDVIQFFQRESRLSSGMAAAHYTQRQSWRKRNVELLLRLEDGQIDGVGHGFVPGIIRVPFHKTFP